MQVMQAFFLSIISGIISAFFDILNPLYRIPFLGTAISALFGIVTSIISLIILIMTIIGIVKVSKGNDANLPLVSGFAQKAFGIVKKVSYTQTPSQGQDNSNNNTQN